MATRKDRVLSAVRTWKMLPTPPPRDWVEIFSESEVPLELAAEFFMLVRQLWLLHGADAEARARMFPGRIAHHVAERRSDAIAEAPYTIRSSVRVLMRMGRRK